MKIYSDYTQKYSKKDTLIYISHFKKDILDMFNKMFKLVEIEQQVVSNLNSVYSNQRKITFDNSINEQVYEIPSYINLNLINAVDILCLEPKQGVICYAPTIHRDIEPSPSEANAESIIYLNIREYLANINYDTMYNVTAEIVDALNNLPTRKEVGLKLPKTIKVTSIDKLAKQYPTVDKSKLISQACIRHKLIFVQQTSGNNRRKLSFLERKLGTYGDDTATLYVYNSVSNTPLKLLTIYSIPSKDQTEKTMVEEEFSNEMLSNILKKIPETNNQYGIEFHFSNYLVYTLSKYSINEIVSCPCSLEMNAQRKKDIIM